MQTQHLLNFMFIWFNKRQSTWINMSIWVQQRNEPDLATQAHFHFQWLHAVCVLSFIQHNVHFYNSILRLTDIFHTGHEQIVDSTAIWILYFTLYSNIKVTEFLSLCPSHASSVGGATMQEKDASEGYMDAIKRLCLRQEA